MKKDSKTKPKSNSGRKKRTEEVNIRAKDKAEIKNQFLHNITAAGELRNLMRELALRDLFEAANEHFAKVGEPLLTETIGPKNFRRIPKDIIKEHLNMDFVALWQNTIKDTVRAQSDCIKVLEPLLSQKTKEDLQKQAELEQPEEEIDLFK